jgi:molybdenum cofactor cytidylyltransferase
VNIAGIILAGGASRRMGFPKALLDYRGETFLDRLIRIFSCNCDSVTVVLGAEADRIRSGLLAPGRAQFVVNDRWDEGQLTSFQTGLRAAGDSVDAVLFTPVDYPSIDASTVAAVVKAAATAAEGTLFVRPRYAGRRGHPVLFDAKLAAEFLALPAGGNAREVVHKYVDRTVYVDVEDSGIIRDVDDRLAYEEILAAPRTS